MQGGVHDPGFGQPGIGAEEAILDLPEVRLEAEQRGGGQELLGAGR